jgi:hypothetical protein
MTKNTKRSIDNNIENNGLSKDKTEINYLDPTSGHLPYDLVASIRNVYEPAGLKVTKEAVREAESSEYGACRFGLNGHAIVFRIAKTTPTKIGQFVTIWKRPTTSGIIAPFDISDDVAFVIVSVSDAQHCGQFVFDQKTLVAKGIMSRGGKGGKRGIRVYPPWSEPLAKDAVRTQKWQLQYFLPFAQGRVADSVQVRRHFLGNNEHDKILESLR